MKQVARLAHLMGMVLMLGSILTFVVASSVGAAGSLEHLLIARRIISTGTKLLTLPGLGLVAASGVALVTMDWSVLRQRWMATMAISTAAIVANGILLVVPSVRSATALAEASAASGTLVPGYQQAYVSESVAGGANVVLMLIAMVAGVWRFGRSREATH